MAYTPRVGRSLSPVAAIALVFAAAASTLQAASCAAAVAQPPSTEDASVRPFRARVPDAALEDLRRRVRATRWPDMETVPDQSQGIKLAKLKPIVEHWGRNYDWRRTEARLNAYPQFTTTIDGVRIQFIHVRSKNSNALPVIITHGWPGSILEQVKIIGPLTDPTAFGGRAEDAFDVVIPSMPGFGFSGKPRDTGWGPERIAKAWTVLMQRLGYTHYVAQGGDWGSPVSSAMARQSPPGLKGIHINLPAAVPPDIAALLASGGPAPADLSNDERAAFDELSVATKMGNRSYATIMGTRPQTIGYALSDSPTGLLAWMLGHPGFTNWTYDATDPERSPDEVLDETSFYWLTNSGTSAGRIYWEYNGRSPVLSGPEKTSEIKLPVAVTVFPGETYQAPETWVRRAYPSLTYFHRVDRGGHFAAWEQPQLFAEELRSAFRPLRK